jgi:hypothetical protein
LSKGILGGKEYHEGTKEEKRERVRWVDEREGKRATTKTRKWETTKEDGLYRKLVPVSCLPIFVLS